MVVRCVMFSFIFCVKQKTEYEMRISDWSSDVCSSDLFSFASPAPPRVIAAACRNLMQPLFHGDARQDSGKLERCRIVHTGEHWNGQARHLALGGAVLPDPQPGQADRKSTRNSSH